MKLVRVTPLKKPDIRAQRKQKRKPESVRRQPVDPFDLTMLPLALLLAARKSDRGSAFHVW